MQNETITKQLDAGVRYFDLRIARKPRDTNSTRLYFHHGLYTKSDVEVQKMLKCREKKSFLQLEILYNDCAILFHSGLNNILNNNVHFPFTTQTITLI